MTGHDDDSARAEMAREIEIMTASCRRCLEGWAELDPVAAFALAGELRDTLESLRRMTSALRANLAATLYREARSLADVGQAIGLTKARAAQLVAESRRHREVGRRITERGPHE